MLDVWQGCQQYYYRCISRKAQFTVSLAAPSKVSKLIIDPCPDNFFGPESIVCFLRLLHIFMLTSD